jgi:hypothetical protein
MDEPRNPALDALIAQNLDDRDLAPLFSRSDLAELVSLELLDVPDIDRFCKLLTKAPFAPQLHELIVYRLTDTGAAALAKGAASFERLKVLSVDDDQLTGDGVAALESMDIPKLEGVSRYDDIDE